MNRQACIIIMVVAAGCGDNLSGADNLLADAGSTANPMDADTDGAIDAPVDTPPLDLTELCGSVPVTLDDWESCYQKRWCKWEVGCLPLNTYRDVQECLVRSDEVEGGRLSAERREHKRAVEQGLAKVNYTAFTQCLVETSETRCNTAPRSVACATRFTGTINDGDSCFSAVDCASPGAECVSDCTGACCLGSCRPKFKEGEACDYFDSCEPGLRCHHICLSGDIGTSCASNRDCDPNAWCDTGTCKADFMPGAACTSPLQCGGDTSCIGLSIIDSSPGHCLSISKVGDHCDSFCYGNLYCDASGICRELPGLGDSCPEFTPCSGVDTVCSNGECVLRGDAGATCSSSQPCQPGWFCTSELDNPKPTCVPPGDPGQPCADPSHCKSHLCSGTGMCIDTCPPGGT